jgi:hypothetical protein
MCWFSAEYAQHTVEARAGQRLGIRKMYRHSSWVVRESELETPSPTPVCLLDGTKVLFRFSEDMEGRLQLGLEAEATFRMLRKPKRDAFEFANGKQIQLDAIPASVIFDVLIVPGAEQDSALLTEEPGLEPEEAAVANEKEPFLARLFARL